MPVHILLGVTGLLVVAGGITGFVTAVIRFIAAQALTVRDFRTVFPTLEDVFLELTGHDIRD